ncbi:hypothetical protein FI667_g11812, partial [Globisporangium splendens]
MKTSFVLSTRVLVLAVLAPAAVLGHGYVISPAAQWTEGYPHNGYISEVNGSIWGEIDGFKYGWGPEGAVKFIAEKFPESGVASLKDLILENQVMWTSGLDEACGYTKLDETKRSKLPTEMKFGNGDVGGFTHPGPCELWCDDTKLSYDNDCAAKYPSGLVPIDKSKCANANQFTVYWLAVHASMWQVYSGSGGAATASKAPASAPAATTVAPVAGDADDEASASTADDEYATDAPAATPAPAVASTPSPTKKCTAKTHRA